MKYAVILATLFVISACAGNRTALEAPYRINPQAAPELFEEYGVGQWPAPQPIDRRHQLQTARSTSTSSSNFSACRNS